MVDVNYSGSSAADPGLHPVVVEVHHPQLSRGYVQRTPGAPGGRLSLQGPDHGNSFHLYDLTGVLGGPDWQGRWSSTRKCFNEEFVVAVSKLAPVIRSLADADWFYRRLGEREKPGVWKSGSPYPPVTPGGALRPRFGFRYLCDYSHVSGCGEWLEIFREHALYPDRAVYSITMSNGVHRHACNHCTTRGSDRSDPADSVPALHPAVVEFIRTEVRERKGKPPLTYSVLAPALKVHLQTAKYMHCGLPLPGKEAYRAGRKADKKCTLCWHQNTYEGVAQAAVPYFPQAQKMPCPVHSSRTSHVRNGARGTERLGHTTRPEPVTLHHMMLRQGGNLDGRPLFDPVVIRQVKNRLKSINKDFKTIIGPSRPENNSMEAFWKIYETENLWAAWNARASGVKGHEHFDVFKWRMVGLLYRKRAGTEPASSKGCGKADGDVAFQHPLTVDDFMDATGPGAKRGGSADHDYEMVAVMGSMASLIVSVKAWACREVTGGVVLGLDHMYNFLKGTSNVRSSTCCASSPPGELWLLLTPPPLCHRFYL